MGIHLAEVNIRIVFNGLSIHMTGRTRYSMHQGRQSCRIGVCPGRHPASEIATIQRNLSNES
jgi:hypothetical protein